MREQHGMQHTATIDLPFSDERAPRPAEQAAESAAFMARIQAAARQVPRPDCPGPARPILDATQHSIVGLRTMRASDGFELCCLGCAQRQSRHIHMLLGISGCYLVCSYCWVLVQLTLHAIAANFPVSGSGEAGFSCAGLW